MRLSLDSGGGNFGVGKFGVYFFSFLNTLPPLFLGVFHASLGNSVDS